MRHAHRQAAKRLAEAEKSGASIVLALLRASVASKSIRVIELFNAMDTSKDGLISRWGTAGGVNRCCIFNEYLLRRQHLFWKVKEPYPLHTRPTGHDFPY